MKKFVATMVLAITAVSMIAEATARPMGGKRSFGRQSQAVQRMPAPAPAPTPGRNPLASWPVPARILPAPREPLPGGAEEAMGRGAAALLAFLVGLGLVAAAGWYGAAQRAPDRARVAIPPAPAPEALRAQLAAAEARIAQLEQQLAQARAGQGSPEPAQATSEAALRLARVVYRALQQRQPQLLQAMAEDPREVEVHLASEGREVAGTLADPAVVAELSAWVAARAPAGDPPAQYVPDAHAPDPARAYHNVILQLQPGYLFLQWAPGWWLVKVAGLEEEPALD